MPKITRLVIPGIPHHITQRGNRKMQTFFSLDDYEFYKNLLRSFAQRANTTVLAWCLMPNHVHVVAVPDEEDGLRKTFAPLHRMYAQGINSREGWKGHLWQERFSSIALDEAHTIAAVRYVDLNPVRAGIVESPEEYPWSSVRSHLGIDDDGITDRFYLKEIVDDWEGLLGSGLENSMLHTFRKHEINGLPVGNEAFLERLGQIAGRRVIPLKRGGSRYRKIQK